MARPAPTTDAVRTAMLRCDRSIRGHGMRSASTLLQDLPSDLGIDTYGDGGVVDELEDAVCEVLGAPASVFMPSGTMAQQIALRIHADRRGLPVVALHPTSHLLLHESHAHERLHGLRTTVLGAAARPWSLSDVDALAEPVAAVAVELPLRELGGLLPPWEDVCGLAADAHDRDAAVHLDGARIWEAAAGYGRSPAEVAACADSTYVSFYKGLGGIAGAALVGDEDLITTARLWRHRHGGTLFGLWPYAAAALHGLRTRLPRMGAYLDLARQIAGGLAAVDGVEIVPEVPDTSMLHLHVQVAAEAFTASAMTVAVEEGIATWPAAYATARPGWQVVELAVGDATVDMGAEDVVAVITRLIGRARVAARHD